MMTPERWQEVDRILETALDLAARERAEFLRRACAGDDGLRHEVEALLEAHERAGGFIESPPREAFAELMAAADAMAGGQIGPYRILREVGRGGMGVVYLAARADDEYKQQVAIKLVWPGPHNRELLRRFRRERQILANLDHPNISRLLDGGRTEQGWPYLVMEYIAGAPIATFCADHKLSITERLALFRKTCSAAQYAHQNLIIHRDLKPSNILVTEDGEVKLLDFGIAKLLDPAMLQMTAYSTTEARFLMTPEYASPEQMRGEPITTASDVYSLGVVLYELLTGHSPYRFKDRSLPELARVVCEQEPQPPSAIVPRDDASAPSFGEARAEKLRARLRGDLNNIALTALRKDPQLRYRGVEQLSEDIARHLSGQPILAQTGTLRYRAGKFVRRNRFSVAAAAIVLLTLIAGIIATSWQARRAAEQARLNRRLLYAAQMNLAGQAWDAANVARVAQLVESNFPQAGQEDLRGFEWYYLWRLHHRNLRMTMPHPAEVRAVALSPDGTKMATGDSDGTARLWEAATGRLLATLRGHTGSIHSIAFSPDGGTLATGAGDYLIILWDAVSGRQLARMIGNDDTVLKLALSPDGKWLTASSHGPVVQLFNLAGDPVFIVLNGHSQGITGLAFSPDSQLIASGSDDSLVKVWEVPAGDLPAITRRCERNWCPMTMSDKGILTPFWNEDGCHNKIKHLATPEVAALKGHRGRVYSVAFSPDGKLLASASDDRSVKLWDTTTWREIGALEGHTAGIRAVVFSPDGKTLASGGDDRLARLWDVAARRQMAAIKGHGGRIYSLAFSPEGGSVATASDDHTAKLWDVTASFRLFTDLEGHADEVNFAAFSPDGNMVATGSDDKTIKLWDTATGRELKTLAGHTRPVQAVAYSPDGKRLASASRSGVVIVWDANSGQERLNFRANQEDAIAVAFSPDGRKLATGGEDDARLTDVPIRGAKVWDAVSGQLLSSFGGHTRRVLAVAFSADGRLLASGSADRMVKLWEVETGREVAALAGHQSDVWGVSFSPDGRVLVSGGDDRTIRFWDLRTGREMAKLEAHSDAVRALAFSPDGRRLATASKDHTVKLWDTTTYQELITLTGHTADVWNVAFSPDGLTLATASGDRTARLWRAATEREVAAANSTEATANRRSLP